VTRRRRPLTCSPARLFLLLLLLLLLLPACSSRSLTIKSNPSGADVFLDGEYAGVTPVTVPFVYGGQRDVLVYKRATETRAWRPERVIYDTHRRKFDVPVIDLVADITGSEDKQTVTVELKESNERRLFEQDKDAWSAAVRARANTLRVRAREAQLGARPSDEGRDPGPLETRATSRPAPAQPANPAGR
jgi:PEGA domain